MRNNKIRRKKSPRLKNLTTARAVVAFEVKSIHIADRKYNKFDKTNNITKLHIIR